MNKKSKCTNCGVFLKVMASTKPHCCEWYMNNVVSGEKSIEDCTVRESMKPDEPVEEEK